MTLFGIAIALLPCLLLLVAAPAAAALLRSARCPGAAVVGGVAVGLLLGPGVLGRALPDTYERVILGGATERAARDTIARQHDRELAVATHAGARQRAGEVIESRDRELPRANEHLEQARRIHQTPRRLLITLLAGAVLLSSGTGRRGPGRSDPAAGTIMSIGAWAAAVPGAIVWTILYGLLEVDLAPACLAATAVAVGPWQLRPSDRDAADDAELDGARLVRSGGRIASFCAVLVAALVLARAGTLEAFLAGLVLLVCLLPAPALHTTRALVAIDAVVVPSLAAGLAMHVDPLADFRLWPFLTILLATGDGRWTGAILGTLIPGGRRWSPTMRLTLGSMACGPTQLALAAAGAATGILSPDLLLALLAGAVLVELSAPARRAIAHSLADLE